MPNYHAIYRVPSELVYPNVRCVIPTTLHSSNSFSKTDEYGKYVSYACDIDDLTKSRLKELVLRVGEKHAIRVCEDWNADCDEHYVILLITDSDYENLDPAIQIRLGGMKNRYEQAIKDADEIVAPLKHCINTAKKIIRACLYYS